MVSTKCSFMALRRFSGTSARSFSLSLGRMASNSPARCAASKFFFQSADGQNFAAQSDFAGHGDIAAHGNLAERAGNRRGDGDAGRRAVFGNGAFRHVHVNIDVAIEVARQAQARGARAYVRHRSLRRFLHHVAELCR